MRVRKKTGKGEIKHNNGSLLNCNERRVGGENSSYKKKLKGPAILVKAR